ncbi:hypothetical protein [Paraferrimonas haliotis]|uniref:hypothetical protein n=1 Tax=Paraferrimonas haliotis TaxID=2013866 RepID=UPI000BA938AA|nr:hypothetical protein [Paraferrimonas haliotis]
MEFLLKIYFCLILLYVLASTVRLRRILARDLFHPQLICRIIVTLTLVLPFISIEREYKFDDLTNFYILSVALFFLVCLDLISINIRRVKHSFEFFEQSRFFLGVILLIFLIGWAFRFYALKHGLLYGTFLSTKLETQSYSNVVSQANSISTISLFALLIFKNNKPTLLTYNFILLELIWVFISGSKIALLYILIPVSMIFIKRGWISLSVKKALTYGIVCLVFLKLSFTFVTSYRIAVQTAVSSGSEMELTLIANSLVDNVMGNTDYKTVESKNNEILERLDWYGFFGYLYERDDLYKEYRFGSTYLPIFNWWVPRFIWKDKGSVSIGGWYGKEVLGWDYDSRSEGAITIWGDALLNFGYIGPFVVSGVWIFLVVQLYNFLCQYSSWTFLALCCVYVRMILGMEQNLAASLVTIQFQIIFIFTLYLISNIFRFSFNKK